MIGQVPSLGRVVHYQAPTDCGGEIWPGIVVAARERPDGSGHSVDVVTFGSHSIYHNNGVPFSQEPAPGHAFWPPRV